MDKTSHSVNGEGSVKGVMRPLVIDLTELPEEGRADLGEQRKDDVPPPPHFYIDLCSPEENMEVLKQKHKVLGSSSVAGSDHLKNLGFDGCDTFMSIRDKRVQFPGKSLYALGRSWFKEGFTEKDKPLCAPLVEVRKEGDNDKGEKRNEDDEDHWAAKELLRDFINLAKTRARIARKKGKKVLKQVCAPRLRRRKNKFPQRLRLV